MEAPESYFNILNWDSTKESLKNLENLLLCSKCACVPSCPYTLGGCDHVYCEDCKDAVCGSACTVCGIPAPACDAAIDTHTATLLEGCNKIRNLINNKPGADSPRKSKEFKVSEVVESDDKENLTKDKKKPAVNSSKVTPLKATKENNKNIKHTRKRSGKVNTGEVDKLCSNDDERKKAAICTTPKRIRHPTPEVSTPSVEFTKKNKKGETPLHVAAIKGDVERVKALLEDLDTKDINIKDNAGWTPLHEACIHGNVAIAELLILAGAYVNITGGDNDTALHDAVSHNNKLIVQLLMKHGADSNAINIHGNTPIDLSRDEEMRELLHKSSCCSAIPPTPLQHTLTENIVISTSGLTELHIKQVVQLTRILKAKYVKQSNFNQSVTHLVAGVENGYCLRNGTYMSAILNATCVLNYQWVEECIGSNSYVETDAYEVEGTTTNPCSNASKKSRENKLLQRPGLFDGCHFYLRSPFSPPTPSKPELTQLIELGGGEVLKREPRENIEANQLTVPLHADRSGPLATCGHYIIYQEGKNVPAIQYNMPHLKSLPSMWLLDCIDAFSLIEPYT